MYEKLLAVLRHCGNENVPCEGCPVHNECGCFDIGAARNMKEAADAIERLSRECKVLYAMLGTHPDPRGELGDPGVLREPPKEEA